MTGIYIKFYVLFTVLYCILLAAAQSDQEREEIENKMRSQPDLAEILHQLLEGESEDMVQVGHSMFYCHHLSRGLKMVSCLGDL